MIQVKADRGLENDDALKEGSTALGVVPPPARPPLQGRAEGGATPTRRQPFLEGIRVFDIAVAFTWIVYESFGQASPCCRCSAAKMVWLSTS
jgi:hypothetical protein